MCDFCEGRWGFSLGCGWNVGVGEEMPGRSLKVVFWEVAGSLGVGICEAGGHWALKVW